MSTVESSADYQDRKWSKDMDAISATRLTGALTATMGVSALLTSGVSALGPPLREDLALSRVELSLFSLVVFITAAATSIPWGVLADRLRPLWGIALTFLMAVLGLTGAALAQSLPVLLAAAAAGGCSLAIAATVTNKLVGQFVEQRRRGRVLSTKQMGVQFAQVLAGLLFPSAAVVFNWRIGLVSGAAVGLVALMLIFLTGRQSFSKPVESQEHPSMARAVEESGSIGLLLLLAVYALTTAVCFQSNLFGLPLVGYEDLNFDVQTSSRVVVVLGAVGFVARLAWGRVADRPFQIRMMLLSLGGGLLAGEIIVALAIHTRLQWMFWMGAVFVGTSFALVPVVLSAIVLQHFPLGKIGVISGVISVSTFSGFAAGPLLFGTVADVWSSSHSSLMLVMVAGLVVLTPMFLRTARKPAIKYKSNENNLEKVIERN